MKASIIVSPEEYDKIIYEPLISTALSTSSKTGLAAIDSQKLYQIGVIPVCGDYDLGVKLFNIVCGIFMPEVVDFEISSRRLRQRGGIKK